MTDKRHDRLVVLGGFLWAWLVGALAAALMRMALAGYYPLEIMPMVLRWSWAAETVAFAGQCIVGGFIWGRTLRRLSPWRALVWASAFFAALSFVGFTFAPAEYIAVVGPRSWAIQCSARFLTECAALALGIGMGALLRRRAKTRRDDA